MMRAKRNVRIEALRILAMLLVVACHMTIHLDWDLMATDGWKLAAANTIVQGGQLGVALFYMITGYFLVDKEFKPSRLVRTWLQVFLYGALILGAVCALRCGGRLSMFDEQFASWGLAATLQKELTPITSCAYWFMTAYFGLMLVSPFLNVLFKHAGKRAMLALTIGLVLVESSFLLRWEAIQLTRLLKAITCYLVGGCIAKYSNEMRVATGKTVVLVVAVCLLGMLSFNYLAKLGIDVIAWLGWEQYWHDGPWMLWMVPAGVLLSWASGNKKDYPTWISHAVLTVAPTTFGVYLLHENYLGNHILWRVVNRLFECPQQWMTRVGAFGLLLLGIFASCAAVALFIDWAVVNRLSTAMADKLDQLDRRWRHMFDRILNEEQTTS